MAREKEGCIMAEETDNCKIIDKIEKELVHCKEAYLLEQIGQGLKISEALELRRLFDKLRSPLGCGERPKEVEDTYDSLG
jgi:hypothetical protein